MSNLPSKVLRLLVTRGHGMTLGEIQAAFPGVKRPAELGRAIDALKFAKLISWTTQGWLGTEFARWCMANRTSLRFTAGRVRGG